MSKQLKKEKQIEDMMLALGVSREEATELVEFDNEEFELEEVQEMEKKAKGIIKADRAKAPKKENEKTGMLGVQNQKRAKKENPTKQEIIKALEKALQDLEIAVDVDVKNVEKTIMFKVGENTFEIDLKQKRQPKA